VDEDQKIELGKFDELEKFYLQFADKILAFDPLDREIKNLDDED
jgi:hypothetical protein